LIIFRLCEAKCADTDPRVPGVLKVTMTSERFGGEHAAQTCGVHDNDVIKTA
jgi:hypothetical protein